MDYSDFVNIKITKVTFQDDPTHWELDITSAEGVDLGGGTSPNFAGIMDMAYSMIRGGDKHSNGEVNEWAEFDANKRG